MNCVCDVEPIPILFAVAAIHLCKHDGWLAKNKPDGGKDDPVIETKSRIGNRNATMYKVFFLIWPTNESRRFKRVNKDIDLVGLKIILFFLAKLFKTLRASY